MTSDTLAWLILGILLGLVIIQYVWQTRELKRERAETDRLKGIADYDRGLLRREADSYRRLWTNYITECHVTGYRATVTVPDDPSLNDEQVFKSARLAAAWLTEYEVAYAVNGHDVTTDIYRLEELRVDANGTTLTAVGDE